MTRMMQSRIAAVLLFACAGMPVFAPAAAGAAEPVFPTGSRLGLVPPPGLTAGEGIPGFSDVSNKTAILLLAYPPQAYAALEKSVTVEALKEKGLVQESREPFPLAAGKAFLIISRQSQGSLQIRKWLLVASTSELTALVTVQVPDTARAIYPDAAIRKALATLAVRDSVPDEEKLSLLPFRVTERAGFKIGNVAPGRAVNLSDAAGDSQQERNLPRLVIAVAPATPAQMEDRDALAQQLFLSLVGVEELRITEAGALRIGGQHGHQILATAKDATTGTELTIVQWLRFGGGGFMQMMGISPTKDWKQAYPRFREVRDGIRPR